MTQRQAWMACADWLSKCLRLGWPKSALDDLERLWWQYHAHPDTEQQQPHPQARRDE